MENLHFLPSFLSNSLLLPYSSLHIFLSLPFSLPHHVFLLFRAPSSASAPSHYSLCKTAKPPPVSSTRSSFLSHLSCLSCDLFLPLVLSQTCPGDQPAPGKVLKQKHRGQLPACRGERWRETEKHQQTPPNKTSCGQTGKEHFPGERAKRFCSL